MSERITSARNPRIRDLARLSRRSERDRRRQFLVEGAREVERASAGGVDLELVVVCRRQASEEELRLADALDGRGVEIVDVGPAAYGALSIRRHPGGLLAVAVRPEWTLDDIDVDADAIVLTVDGVEKPGNLGAMLRTADAVGASLVAADAGTDLTNPNVVRASQGSLFSVSVAVATPDETLRWANHAGLRVLAADPRAADDLWSAPMEFPAMLVIGSEHEGLGSTWATSPRVRIPVQGLADSLNASVAAAVLLFEAVRRRRTPDV